MRATCRFSARGVWLRSRCRRCRSDALSFRRLSGRSQNSFLGCCPQGWNNLFQVQILSGPEWAISGLKEVNSIASGPNMAFSGLKRVVSTRKVRVLRQMVRRPCLRRGFPVRFSPESGNRSRLFRHSPARLLSSAASLRRCRTFLSVSSGCQRIRHLFPKSRIRESRNSAHILHRESRYV